MSRMFERVFQDGPVAGKTTIIPGSTVIWTQAFLHECNTDFRSDEHTPFDGYFIEVNHIYSSRGPTLFYQSSFRIDQFKRVPVVLKNGEWVDA